jgi:hypothetical protein
MSGLVAAKFFSQVLKILDPVEPHVGTNMKFPAIHSSLARLISMLDHDHGRPLSSTMAVADTADTGSQGPIELIIDIIQCILVL